LDEALIALGWTPLIGAAFQPHAQDHVLGRVSAEHRGAFIVATADGDLWAKVAGRLRHHTPDRADLPATGDWVAMRVASADDWAVVDAVLPRTAVVVRKEAGSKTQPQVIAANLDLVWIVASMTRELSARRVERYLSVAWESGAQPVVVLTKADVNDADPSIVAEVEQIAIGADLVVTSAVTNEGMDILRDGLQAHRTAALLGSSGVGKSTLVNTLVGEELLETRPTRNDAVGRHTTVRREMVRVPTGGLLIDTPGLRELVSWQTDPGTENGFSDIEELAATCRFSDCTHTAEPGCAIRDALVSGELDPARWRSYGKMLREERFLTGRKRGLEKAQSKAAKQRKKREIEDREGIF
jgi:ribosome biogenesis GTPase